MSVRTTVNVNIQSQASVAITSMALTPIAAPGPYVGGMTMTLTITFSNTGGTAATVDATIDDGAYTGLTLTSNPTAVTVAASSHRSVQHPILLADDGSGVDRFGRPARRRSTAAEHLANISASNRMIRGYNCTMAALPLHRRKTCRSRSPSATRVGRARRSTRRSTMARTLA
jgi:hypothetical protein